MIGLLIAAGYLAAGLISARLCYRRNRPSGVPLCGVVALAVHYDGRSRPVYGHVADCYDRGRAGSERDRDPWTCATVGGAVAEAILCGLLWPAIGLCGGIYGVITLGHPETPAEAAVRKAELEADIKRLEIES